MIEVDVLGNGRISCFHEIFVVVWKFMVGIVGYSWP